MRSARVPHLLLPMRAQSFCRASHHPCLVRVVLVVVLVVLTPATAWAQAGKISGTITDAATGETLPGANVVVSAEIVGGEEIPLSSVRGAVSNNDGRYFILNVRPGRYVVEASFVGFQSVVKKPIQVQSNRTAEVNFALPERTFQGEEVVVTAQPTMVTKDLTASSAKVSGEDINALPVENIQDVLELQAGVTTDIGGGLHIRGGRSSEVQYYVDGIAVSNPFTNDIAVPVEKNAIQELEVISGTFNAEYGQAMSGIINIVTREGTSELKGSLSAYTGDFVSGNDDLFFNVDDISPTGQQYLEGTLSGPLPVGNLNFFVSGRYTNQQNWLWGRRVFRPSDVSDFSAADPDEWLIENTGDSSAVSMNPFESLSGQAKLTWRPTGTTKLSYNLLLNRSEGQSYNHFYRLNPEALPTNHTTGVNHLLRLEQTLNARTFVTLNLSLYENELESYVYEDPFDPRYQALAPIRQEPQFVLSTGSVDPDHLYRTSRTYATRLDLTMQVDDYNLVKMGIEGRLHQLDFQQFQVQVRPQVFGDSLPRVPPTTSLLNDDYRHEPIELSAYIQDKIEIQDLVVNAGIRFDYFDARAPVPTDLRDPSNRLLPRDSLEAFREADAKTQIAPRLGLAFPITERGVFHASYGQFFQIPAFARLYENPEFEVLGTFQSFVGNANLDAQRTTMYEIGLQQELFPFMAADITAFYRDVRNLLGADLIDTYRSDVSYGRYVTDDFGSVRGVTVALDVRLPEEGVSAGLNYTYQVAKGLASNPKQEFIDAAVGNEPPVAFLPLNWDLRHTGSAFVNYTRPSWAASVIVRANSGYPFTPDEYRVGSEIVELRNRARFNGDFFVDLRAAKRFQVGALEPEVFVKIENLLDYQRNDRLPEIDPRTAEEFVRLGLDRINTIREFELTPTVQPIPREVRLGLNVSF